MQIQFLAPLLALTVSGLLWGGAACAQALAQAPSQALVQAPVPTFGDSPCVERPAPPASGPDGSATRCAPLPGAGGLAPKSSPALTAKP